MIVDTTRAHGLGLPLAMFCTIAGLALPAAAATSDPTFVVVSGRQAATDGEQFCFRLTNDDAATDRVSVRIRFRGSIPSGYLTLDGRRDRAFESQDQVFTFAVSPRGIHRLTLELSDAATIDWLSLVSDSGDIEQASCAVLDVGDGRRDDGIDAYRPAPVDRLEHHDSSRYDEPSGYDERRDDRDRRRDTGAYDAVIPADARLELILDQRVSTQTHRAGQEIQTHLAAPVVIDGRTILPEGTRVVGTVAQSQPAGRFGRARLRLTFGRAELNDGTIVQLAASVTQLGQGSAGKQAGIIAGSAVGGAVVGKAVGGGGRDALLGAIVGGAIATGAIAAKPGKPVMLPAGTLLVVQLDRSAHVPIRDRRYR